MSAFAELHYNHEMELDLGHHGQRRIQHGAQPSQHLADFDTAELQLVHVAVGEYHFGRQPILVGA